MVCVVKAHVACKTLDKLTGRWSTSLPDCHLLRGLDSLVHIHSSLRLSHDRRSSSGHVYRRFCMTRWHQPKVDGYSVAVLPSTNPGDSS